MGLLEFHNKMGGVYPSFPPLFHMLSTQWTILSSRVSTSSGKLCCIIYLIILHSLFFFLFSFKDSFRSSLKFFSLIFPFPSFFCCTFWKICLTSSSNFKIDFFAITFLLFPKSSLLISGFYF